MKLGNKLSVYLYSISITPEIIDDAYIIHGIFGNLRRRLNSILDIHTISGRNLFTTTDLQESILIKSEFKNQEYEVLIDVGTKHFVSGANMDSLKMEDHSLVHNLINIVIK